MAKSMLDIYNSVYEKFSRYQYTPALATAELASLITLYVAGMAIAIYRLPLSGPLMATHIYAAALAVIFAIGIYASATTANSHTLRVLAVLDILSVLTGAFEGLFYFGGFTIPDYALGMGTGFVFTVVFTSAILFYSIKNPDTSRYNITLIASIVEAILLSGAFVAGTNVLLNVVQFPLKAAWEAALLSIHISLGVLSGLGGVLLFALSYLSDRKDIFRLSLLTIIFIGIAAAGGLAYYHAYDYAPSYIMAVSLLIAIINSVGVVVYSS